MTRSSVRAELRGLLGRILHKFVDNLVSHLTGRKEIMAEQLYRVVFEGEILEGRDVQEVKRALAKLYKAGDDQVERFFSGKRLAVKKDVDYETAMKYVKAFERAGAVCKLEALEPQAGLEQPLMLEKDTEEEPHQEGIQPQAGPGQPLILEKDAEEPVRQDGMMVCPKCEFEQEHSEECIRCGIIISKFTERSQAPEIERREEDFKVESAPSNFKWLAIAAVLVVALLFGGFYYFSGTPRYSLYKLGRAMKNHDSEEFHKYVDVDRIVDHLAKFAVQQIAAQMEGEAPTGDWGKPAEEFDKELFMMMLPGMLEAMKPQVKQAITELVEDTHDEREGSPLLGASLAGIETTGSTCKVTVEDERTGHQFRFKMIKTPERYWKIVEIELDSFHRLSQY